LARILQERPFVLSLNFIRDNRLIVDKAITQKNVALDLGVLLALDGDVRAMKSEIDELRRQRNEISASFKDADPAERPALGARAKPRLRRRARRSMRCCCAYRISLGTARRSAPMRPPMW
jgi:hypothetical protein